MVKSTTVRSPLLAAVLLATLPVLLAPFPVLLAPFPARADDPATAPPDLRSTLQAAYDKADAAFFQRDLDNVFASYAPDFVAVGDAKSPTQATGTAKDGAVGKDGGTAKDRHLVRYLLAACDSVLRTSETLDDAPADKTGAAVVATVRHHFEGSRPNAQTAQEDMIVINRTDRDFWVRAGGGWQLKREKTLTSETRVNGDVIPGGVDAVPETPIKYDLSGIWAVQSPAGHYVVRINQYSSTLVATKVTGTAYVPAGSVNFYAAFSDDTFHCKRQLAGLNHTDVEWVPAQLGIQGADDFTVGDPDHGTASYHRQAPQ